MSDVRYHINGGSMKNAMDTMNSHMADADQHVTTTEKNSFLQPTWDNIQNKPNFADPTWKGAVATPTDLPLTGNTIRDMRIVADDGDGKGALYECIATVGTLAQQWKKMSDVDWGIVDWSAIGNKPASYNPSSHKSTHSTGGSDAMSPADIGALPVNAPSVTGGMSVQGNLTVTGTITSNSDMPALIAALIFGG